MFVEIDSGTDNSAKTVPGLDLGQPHVDTIVFKLLRPRTDGKCEQATDPLADGSVACVPVRSSDGTDPQRRADAR